MKSLDSFKIDLQKCSQELNDFKKLLQRHELGETQDILPFFRKRRHLSAFVATYMEHINRFDLIKHEFSLFGDFRSDLVVGDSESHGYCFVEFEDATKDSIFVKSNRSTSEWSPRFEHGFSQLVDWFWKIDDLKNTTVSRTVFGSENIYFHGILVIGRDEFLSPIDMQRLRWRLDKVVVDSKKIICVTFDQLARDMEERLYLYRVLNAESSAK